MIRYKTVGGCNSTKALPSKSNLLICTMKLIDFWPCYCNQPPFPIVQIIFPAFLFFSNFTNYFMTKIIFSHYPLFNRGTDSEMKPSGLFAKINCKFGHRCIILQKETKNIYKFFFLYFYYSLCIF